MRETPSCPRNAQKTEESRTEDRSSKGSRGAWWLLIQARLPSWYLAGIGLVFAQVGKVSKVPGSNGGLRWGATD